MTDLDLVTQTAAVILAGQPSVTSGEVSAAVETALMVRAVARAKLGEQRSERFALSAALDLLRRVDSGGVYVNEDGTEGYLIPFALGQSINDFLHAGG